MKQTVFWLLILVVVTVLTTMYEPFELAVTVFVLFGWLFLGVLMFMIILFEIKNKLKQKNHEKDGS